MKKFVIQVFFFIVIFFIVDKFFYVFVYLSSDYQVDNRLELLLKGKINKEVIILGSSRGAMDIIASQIERETGKSAYNIAFPGSNVEFHDFILKTLLKYNKKPKTIIFAVDDPFELIPTSSTSYRFDRLYPLVKYDYINKELVNRGDRNFTSWFLCLARLNKTNFTLKIKPTKFDSIMSCGSMPIKFASSDFESEFNSNSTIYNIRNESDVKKKSFLSILNVCKKNDIQLIFAFPPNFKNHNKSFENRIRQFAISKSEFFIYNTENPVYKNKLYFYDESHLNIKGAKIFTSELSNYINSNK